MGSSGENLKNEDFYFDHKIAITNTSIKLNKTFVNMFPIAGKTAGPNGLTFFEGTMGVT